MTRLWQPPKAITVFVANGVPRAFTWGGVRFRVNHIALHWRRRIWWRGVWRNYYKVTAHSGERVVLVVIYQDLLNGGWYLQEVFD